MKFYGQLEWLFKSESARVKFENLLKVAHGINAINPLALYDFINLILKPMQSELNLITVELGTGAAKPIGLKDLFTKKMEPYLYEFSRAFLTEQAIKAHHLADYASIGMCPGPCAL